MGRIFQERVAFYAVEAAIGEGKEFDPRVTGDLYRSGLRETEYSNGSRGRKRSGTGAEAGVQAFGDDFEPASEKT